MRSDSAAVNLLRHSLLAWLAGLLLFALGLNIALVAGVGRNELPRSAEHWVQRTLERMTLEEKIGQLLMVRYHGAYASSDSETFERLAREVNELHVGGLIVATERHPPAGFGLSEIYAHANLTNRLQRRARIPLLISADFERTAGFRIRRATGFPHNMAVAASGQPARAEQMGRIAAAEAKALGVHWVLAPVADVNNNPLNPIINIRSFGEDPDEVAALVAAFVRGCEESGVLATVKHFPGAGDLTQDPHMELARVAASRERLDAVELVPFRAAIQAGVSAVMTEHITVPALESDPDLPATFSHAVTTRLLREQLGFAGIIITDAMSMDAIAVHYWPGEAAVRAVEAGADVVLMPPEPRVAFDALRRALATGQLTEERIDTSVLRILRAKARLGLHRQRFIQIEEIDDRVATLEHLSRAQEAADAGVVLVRDAAGLVPLDATRPQRGFLLVVSADPDPYPGQLLEDELKWRVDSLAVARSDRLYFKPKEILLPARSTYDWAVVAVFVRVADRKGTIGLPREQAALVEKMLSSRKPTILIVLGSPYLVEHFPQARTVLCTLSTAKVAERAAIRALFGQVAIRGKLPVTIPNTAARRTGLEQPAYAMKLGPRTNDDGSRFTRVHQLLEEGVATGVFPGGVLAVGHQGRLVALKPVGRLSYDATASPVRADTLYDLASLTKVVGTTTAAMMLYEQGRLPLDAPLARYIPEFAAGPQAEAKSRVEIQHLLAHSSGLPGYIRFFLEVDTRAALLARVYSTRLEYEPGTRSVYSDLGIILLGEVIERVSGQRLDEFLSENLFGPLGMTQMLFNPPRELRSRIASTEEDREFRHRLIRGEVHDENAWVLGGVAGHAGLFSTAGDLAVFCQVLLNGGIYAHRRFLTRETIALFTSRQPIPDSTRALGWDTPSENSSGGHYLASRAFGHTGFTGTSIWIDPEKHLFVVLLTNRVHPSRANIKIRQFRPRLHDAVVEALGLTGTNASKR
ncbi:MAG: glycoside hydrolase family 3 N-terminal domain-containing protein [Terriglobia bacterium]